MRKARLSSQPEDVLAFTSSLAADRWIFDADLAVDRAHVVMLTEEGIITAEISSLILSALDRIQDAGISALSVEEDIHAAIEARLIEMIGEDAGGRMHTGRSRNDEVATCIRVRLRDELLMMMRELIRLRQVLITCAKEHIETLMPGFTHTQHAQPTTLAHHLLAHAGALERDFGRLSGAYTRTNKSPLGAAAFAGTGFPINRARTSGLLGFDGVIENSMDAVSARDFLIESVSASANLMTDLSRIASELILWSTSEFDFVTIDDRYASTSSIMPQKKNPDVAELVRGKAGSVIAAATGILTITKALPQSYNRDLQEATPHLWSAVSDTLASIRMTAGMIDTMEVHRDNLLRQATAGFAMATELADRLVRSCGISFRTAHQIVGTLARTVLYFNISLPGVNFCARSPYPKGWGGIARIHTEKFTRYCVKDAIVKVSKTTILKLTTDEDSRIEKTIDKFTEGMDYASTVVHANQKPMGAMKLQKLTYAHLRSEIGLKSQMSCNVARQTAGAYKTLQAQIRKGETYWQLLKFAPTNIKFSYGRDFSINHDEISITTLDGRQKYGIMNYRYAEQFFDGSWKYQASELVKHKDGNYYFHLVCEKEIGEPDITQASNFMGIDVGINHLAVTLTTNGRRKFFTGGEIKNIRNIYSKQRKRLQEKDTRSATRVLKHQSGREKRFMRDVNHVISRQVIESAIEDNVSVIGLEDLTGIRKRTEVRKKQRYKHNSWAFRELQTFIEYKAHEVGIAVIYVDPRYTSQTCPTCLHISRNNRNGRSFLCEVCGYALNADLVGAMNIEARTRAFRHDLEVQGLVVDSPDETISSETSLKPLPTGRGN